MTDESEGTEPDEQDAGSDPAQAFDALRRSVEKLTRDVGGEMTVIRKGVEAAFEEFEKIQQPPDYGPELGRMVKQVAVVGQHLEALQKLPALRNGPDHYARALENAGDRVSESAARTIEARGQALERVSAELGGYIRSTRQRRAQNWWILGALGVGVTIGALGIVAVPRFLPNSTATGLAATVVGQSRWSAGLELMKAHNETRFNDFLYADRLVQENADTIAACYQSAQKSAKDQKCTISVPASAQ